MSNIPSLPLRITKGSDCKYLIVDNNNNILFKDGSFGTFPSSKELAEFIVEAVNYATGFKALVGGWKKDAEHYEAGLRKVRDVAIKNKKESLGAIAVIDASRTIEMINDILSWEE